MDVILWEGLDDKEAGRRIDEVFTTGKGVVDLANKAIVESRDGLATINRSCWLRLKLVGYHSSSSRRTTLRTYNDDGLVGGYALVDAIAYDPPRCAGGWTLAILLDSWTVRSTPTKLETLYTTGSHYWNNPLVPDMSLKMFSLLMNIKRTRTSSSLKAIHSYPIHDNNGIENTRVTHRTDQPKTIIWRYNETGSTQQKRKHWREWLDGRKSNLGLSYGRLTFYP